VCEKRWENHLKVCYCDESGTGDEPIAVMAGIVVDSQRMHVTKEHWGRLLSTLSEIIGHKLTELHTKDFYRGSGVWRDLDGSRRAEVTDIILEWFGDRKHHVVYSAVEKQKYLESRKKGRIPLELDTLWRFLGFHLILSVQRCFRKQQKRKGNTIFVFDNEERERTHFIDLIMSPPSWSGTYYEKRQSQQPLCEVIDVPYFGDSQDVSLIQVADFIAFFLRRYAELNDGLIPEKYAGEADRVASWARTIAKRSIGRNHIYPKTRRCQCAEIFFSHAPASIREL